MHSFTGRFPDKNQIFFSQNKREKTRQSNGAQGKSNGVRSLQTHFLYDTIKSEDRRYPMKEFKDILRELRLKAGLSQCFAKRHCQI